MQRHAISNKKGTALIVHVCADVFWDLEICFWGARSRIYYVSIFFPGTFGGPCPPNTKKLATLLPLTECTTNNDNNIGYLYCTATIGCAVIRVLSVNGPSNKSSADENISFSCTCDAAMLAAVENVWWRQRAMYLDAVTIGLQGRHWTIQALEHFVFIALMCC